MTDSEYENTIDCTISCGEDDQKGDRKFENGKQYDNFVPENAKTCACSDSESMSEVVDTDRVFEKENEDTEKKKGSSSSGLNKSEESDDDNCEKQSTIYDLKEKYEVENVQVKQSHDMENWKFVDSDDSVCHSNEMAQAELESYKCFWDESSLEFDLKFLNTELPEYDDLLWCDCNGADDDVQLALSDSCNSIWDEIQVDSP